MLVNVKVTVHNASLGAFRLPLDGSQYGGEREKWRAILML